MKATEFETKFMYKVFTGTGYVMFEKKEEAEDYTQYLKAKGKLATMNKWTWETLIEM